MPHASRPPRAFLLLLTYLAFTSLGLPDGLLGVGWASIHVDLHVSTEAVGVILIAATAGYLISSVVAGFTINRWGVGRLLAGSTLLASTALAGYSVSPHVSLMAVAALLLGLGSGAIDSGINAYVAAVLGPRHMNWLHAFFGLGVAVGPLIMTGMLDAGHGWRWGYVAVASAQLLLGCVFLLTASAWTRPDAVAEVDSRLTGSDAEATSGLDEASGMTARTSRITATLRIPALWFGALAFAVYCAIEISTGLWAFLLLVEGRGVDPTVAGLCVSGYWASLFAGRLVQGVVAERLGTSPVLRVSLAGLVVGAALMSVPGSFWITVVGLALVGFAAAPVFPLLTLTTKQRVGAGHADRAIGVQIGAAALGGALIPTAVGALLSRLSAQALGPTLVVLAFGLRILHAAATRRPIVDYAPTASHAVVESSDC